MSAAPGAPAASDTRPAPRQPQTAAAAAAAATQHATRQQPPPIGSTDLRGSPEAALDQWDPMAEDYASARNTLALNPNKEPLSIITEKMKSIDPTRFGNANICEHFAKFGQCMDGDYCSKVHVNAKVREQLWLLQNTYEANRGRILVNSTNLSEQVDLPKPLLRQTPATAVTAGTALAAAAAAAKVTDIANKGAPNANAPLLLALMVANPVSPANFCLKFPFECRDFTRMDAKQVRFYTNRLALKSSLWSTKLNQYHETMAALFEHPYRVDYLGDAIYLSQIVACKIEHCYRRAMVVGVPTDSDLIDENGACLVSSADRDSDNKVKSCYELLLIDLGEVVYLSREEIYYIKADCLSEPPLAPNCRLNNISPQLPSASAAPKVSSAADGWQRMCQAFKDVITEQPYMLCQLIDYVEHDQMYLVDLYSIETRENLASNLAAKLNGRVIWY